MSYGTIHFFSEDVSFALKQKSSVRRWIVSVIDSELHTLGALNFIFCSDSYLLEINQKYLNHDTYTDIITFDNGEGGKGIVGDIFISIERVRENAQNLGLEERQELHRVMIHGVLHLLGYGDKGEKQKELMAAKEDLYLALRNF